MSTKSVVLGGEGRPLPTNRVISEPGRYVLDRDIEVGEGIGILISAPNVRLDLGARSITCRSADANASTFGVLVNYAADVSIIGGAISGFRFGINGNSAAHRLTVRDVKISACTNIGINLGGDGCRVAGCLIENIGGISDEAYASGINVSGAGIVVERNVVRNCYRQAAASPSLAGEGCAVIVNGTAVRAVIRENVLCNVDTRPETIGVFAGGAHVVEGNCIRNFHNGIQSGSRDERAAMARNTVVITAPSPGAFGVSVFREDTSRDNLIFGYDEPVRICPGL